MCNEYSKPDGRVFTRKIKKPGNRQATSLIIAWLLLPFSVSLAQETGSSVAVHRLHINGLALHFDKGQDTNENSWGLGMEKSVGTSESETAILNGWDTFWELDVYQDSYSDTAIAGGFGVHRPVLHYLDFGLKAGLLYEREFEEKAGSPIVPYLLPFVETRFDTLLNIRAILVPPIDKYSVEGLVFLQLIVDLR